MALRSELRSKIERVVGGWFAEGRMFTAFEVSLRLKEQGVRERHRDLKGDVHEIAAALGEAAGYSRTLMDVGAPSQAWVYHRLNDNPYAYVPLDRGGQDGPKPTRGPVTAQFRNPRPLRASVTEPKTNDDGAYGLDAQGCLRISSALLSALGMAPGETVDVVCSARQEQLRILRPSPLNTEPADVQRAVGSDGSLLLEPKLLERAALHGLQCYLVQGGGNLITVSPLPED